MLKKRSRVFAALAAVAALVGGPAVPASADVLFVIDVSAGVTAPATANGVFNAVATITNSGTFGDQSGSRLTISATNGAVTSAPGCTLTAGAATCTAGALPTGASASFTVGITPAAGATSVTTQAVAAAAVLEVNVLDLTNNTATAATGVAYGVDAALSNQPSDVLFGDDTLLTATVTNTKASQTVNAVIASGGKIDERLAIPAGCAVSGDKKNLNCSFALATGASQTFDVAVAVPSSGSSIVSTLTATGVSGGSDSASVTTNMFSSAQAFVPEGDFLTYQGSNQFTKFNVPIGSTTGGGTFLLLRETNIAGTMCGTQQCIQQAAEAIFPSEGKYSGQDPNKPYVWDIKYDERQACNGLGQGGRCLIDMYWIGTGQTQALPMDPCPTFGTTAAPRLNNIDAPCIHAVARNVRGATTYTVAVLRDITIPIISTVSK